MADSCRSLHPNFHGAKMFLHLNVQDANYLLQLYSKKYEKKSFLQLEKKISQSRYIFLYKSFDNKSRFVLILSLKLVFHRVYPFVEQCLLPSRKLNQISNPILMQRVHLFFHGELPLLLSIILHSFFKALVLLYQKYQTLQIHVQHLYFLLLLFIFVHTVRRRKMLNYTSIQLW